MRILKLLVALVFVAQAGVANETDHVANPDTVKITLGKLTDDPEKAGQKYVPATIKSGVAVAIVLRNVVTEDGAYFGIQKSRSLFGKRVWNNADFIQINAGKTLNMTYPNFKLIAPAGFVSGSSKGMKFDFGPKGEVWAVYE